MSSSPCFGIPSDRETLDADLPYTPKVQPPCRGGDRRSLAYRALRQVQSRQPWVLQAPQTSTSGRRSAARARCSRTVALLVVTPASAATSAMGRWPSATASTMVAYSGFSVGEDRVDAGTD